MSVDRAEVARIASLAKLRFDDDEVERLTAELNGILAHVEVLRGLADMPPDEDVEIRFPLASARTGEDGEPDAPGLDPATFAPRWEQGFFVVPPPPGVHAGDTDS